MGFLFFQIIMTLIGISTFKFTHNDLHTNIMFYKTLHLVRIISSMMYIIESQPMENIQIIDFGRAIYTFKSKIYAIVLKMETQLHNITLVHSIIV